MLGAAHAGCFTMAVSAVLSQQGFTAGNLDTKASVELDVTTQTISNIALELTASAIYGVSKEQFEAMAKTAKENCPLSKALAATPITLSVIYQ